MSEAHWRALIEWGIIPWIIRVRAHNQDKTIISQHMIHRFTSVLDTSSLGPPSTILEARLLVFMAPTINITETLMFNIQPWHNTNSIHHHRW